MEVIRGRYVVLLKSDFGFVKSGTLSFDDARLAMAAVTKDIPAKAGIYDREPLHVNPTAVRVSGLMVM